jgi:hypothetical protein
MSQTTFGTKRDELGRLNKTREVPIVVNDDGAYPTMGTRVAREDSAGQEWVKLHGAYWKYPQQCDF